MKVILWKGLVACWSQFFWKFYYEICFMNVKAMVAYWSQLILGNFLLWKLFVKVLLWKERHRSLLGPNLSSENCSDDAASLWMTWHDKSTLAWESSCFVYLLFWNGSNQWISGLISSYLSFAVCVGISPNRANWGKPPWLKSAVLFKLIKHTFN